MQEKHPRQTPDDPRKQIVWVIAGTHLLRCSTASIRPATETEEAIIEGADAGALPPRREDIIPSGR